MHCKPQKNCKKIKLKVKSKREKENQMAEWNVFYGNTLHRPTNTVKV